MGAYCWWGGAYYNTSASWTIYIPQSDVVGIASLSQLDALPGEFLNEASPAVSIGAGTSGFDTAPVLAAADVTSVTGYVSAEIAGYVAAGFLLETS
jgi:hypothetical protein